MHKISPENATTQNRIFAIDALRGLAALYIFTYHLVLVPKPNLDLPNWIFLIIKYGFSGVTLFFILSGFTLYHTTKFLGTNRIAIIFFLKRLFRIAPLYYAWLAILIVYQWGLFGLINHKTEFFLYFSFSYNLFPSYQTGLVWASWFLGVQMVFYLIFPLIYRFVNTTFKALLFCGISILLAYSYTVFVNHFFAEHPGKTMIIYFGFLYQLPIFSVGILTYFIFKKISSSCQSPRFWGSVCLFTAFIGWSIIIFFDSTDLLSLHKILVLSSIYALFILGLVLSPVSFLVNRFNIFFGKISYSLYLNHPGMILIFCPIYQMVYSNKFSTWYSFFVCLIITLIASTVMSYLTNRLIEVPGNALGSSIIGLINRKDK